jgi:hypothetical protein
MSPWYSPRGARRGLLFAAIASALWCGWAVGYLYAYAETPRLVRPER